MDAAAIARRMWVRFETYHDVTYAAPDTRAATDELGCRGGWMGYFGCRAAPLGTASTELVVATFYNFHPSRVAKSVPAVWEVATPAGYLGARLAGADGSLRRILGELVNSPDLAEAAELARAAAESAPLAGRPLGAANAALPWPIEPHLVLWHAATILRESRGDGHVAALLAADVGPCEALLLHATEHGFTDAAMFAARAWPQEEWAATRGRLIEAGLLAEDGALAEPGRALRASIEANTDRAAAGVWTTLGAERTARLDELFTPLARRLVAANQAIGTLPIGMDPAAALA